MAVDVHQMVLAMHVIVRILVIQVLSVLNVCLLILVHHVHAKMVDNVHQMVSRSIAYAPMDILVHSVKLHHHQLHVIQIHVEHMVPVYKRLYQLDLLSFVNVKIGGQANIVM